MNYYNENDPKTAAWLQELVADRLIPPGHIDTRSITDVQPTDLLGYSQCHFFAGIGGWPYALELAGWPVDRPVWTGSCPCQPFSNAGKQLGTADSRHLWPTFFRLIRECRPTAIFGEQVASPVALSWLDGVFDDLEDAGYACGAGDLCAAGVGAPHIRQRIFWLAVAHSIGGAAGLPGPQPWQERHAGVFDHAGNQSAAETERERERRILRLVYAEQPGLERHSRHEHDRRESRWVDADEAGSASEAGPACFWSPSEVVECKDGKQRRIGPGISALADGVPGRVALLRGAGNAIVPQLAAQFIQAATELTP